VMRLPSAECPRNLFGGRSRREFLSQKHSPQVGGEP